MIFLNPSASPSKEDDRFLPRLVAYCFRRAPASGVMPGWRVGGRNSGWGAAFKIAMCSSGKLRKEDWSREGTEEGGRREDGETGAFASTRFGDAAMHVLSLSGRAQPPSFSSVWEEESMSAVEKRNTAVAWIGRVRKKHQTVAVLFSFHYVLWGKLWTWDILFWCTSCIASKVEVPNYSHMGLAIRHKGPTASLQGPWNYFQHT